MRYLLMFVVMMLMQSSFNVCDAKKKQNVVVDTLQMLSSKGDSCVEAFDYFHASLYYKQAYDFKQSVAVTRKLANAYRKMGRNKDCAALLETVPSDSLTYTDFRSLYFAYHNLDNKLKFLFYGNRATAVNPYDNEIVVSMATYYNDSNSPQMAADICKQYLTGDSTNMLVLRQYGYACYLTGKYKEAFDIYKKLEGNGFDNYESTFVMGISLEMIEQYDSAYTYMLRAASHKNFKDYISLHHLGTLCLQLGMNDEASCYLTLAINSLIPDSTLLATLHKEKAEAYFNKQNYAEAAREFEQSAKLSPDNAITYYNIAQMYAAIGDRKKEKANYTLFLQKADTLKETEENKEMIKKVKELLRK